MSRITFILINDHVRARALEAVKRAPGGTRVELKEEKRNNLQNSRMWASLSDIATQAEHNGRRYDTNTWKCIFLHALGRETQFVPSLDGVEIIPIGQSSSDLSKAEMSDLLTFMYSWGAERGIVFHDQEREVDAA